MNESARFERLSKTTPKRPTNVSLSIALVEEAKRLGINVSEACQSGLAAEVKKARQAAWQEENRAAIEASNDYVRKHGLPLAKYRLF
ncbi:type II toxin-antitoxin system CcdA family antitoxin [Sphingopyxis indica]|uniref:Antitoxin CcdA n=1 Tax=Sphingopyxis indica TaxID=436663 RepID=A0A239HYV1_9SPHN|nr:type II toxin-antitoxin system CcdA family antitoxin [Sphingopyxis indica]WOF43200.1 type II toxin-antitoxin system CcdA family antitoxin [Sphingopyxis indica]SNS86411.1 antitoxin CcdA [Sphingopyxis indica]